MVRTDYSHRIRARTGGVEINVDVTDARKINPGEPSWF
jgi:hypothetical protein